MLLQGRALPPGSTGTYSRNGSSWRYLAGTAFDNSSELVPPKPGSDLLLPYRPPHPWRYLREAAPCLDPLISKSLRQFKTIHQYQVFLS